MLVFRVSELIEFVPQNIIFKKGFHYEKTNLFLILYKLYYGIYITDIDLFSYSFIKIIILLFCYAKRT